ncbi:hypothetical protein EJB05_12840, partial [Eragrostis curvula]
MASSARRPGFLREAELRLLRCTLPTPSTRAPQLTSSPPPQHPLGAAAAAALAAVEAGDYEAALAAAAPHLLPASASAGPPGSAAQFYADLAASVQAFLRGGGDGDGAGEAAAEEHECRCAVVLAAAVAALLAFTQENVTGPPGTFSAFPFWTSSLDEGWYNNLGGIWDSWASDNLSSFGSHVHGKFSLLQFIVFAELLFTSTQTLDLSDCLSVSWWLFRLSMFQQNILDELSSSLFDQVQVYKNKMLGHFGELENVSAYWGPLLCDGEGSYFVSAAFLEAGIAEYKYGRVDASRLHLDSAQEACGLHLSLTGILGFRTIHQVDAKSQMVLVAKTSKSEADGQTTEPAEARNDVAPLKSASSSVPVESDEFCDILRTPRLVQDGSGSASENTRDPSAKISLSAIQQASVLAECLHVSRRSRSDEMSGWEMAPYIESIDSQKESYFLVRSLCDILRIRWESTRNRTKQRALLMMENLSLGIVQVEDIGKEIPVAAQRVKLVFGVHMPTLPALRKEYGELLISCGIVGEALDIFKDLELWDNLIYCYRLLGKMADAVTLINARLSVTPNDPRLWCSLGDVTNNDDHYKKALEVSKNKSARAMEPRIDNFIMDTPNLDDRKRSLARSAYNRNDFYTSKTLWESALALNSLFPDGWFAYGTVAWKDKDLDKAVDAFSRSVQIDPENGEAWNNIACLHMIRGKSQAAVQAFREAVKFKRNSWEIWENYSKVALDTGNIRLTLEALKMVLNLSSNKRFNVDILDKVMTLLDKQPTHLCDTQEEDTSADANKDRRQSNHLLDMIGDILQQIVRSGGSNAEIWGLYARWHKIKGNLMASSEALLKQVRSFQVHILFSC